MGKLIVIEGLDGCGKSTQLELLGKRLVSAGVNCKTVSFPDYDSESSALVKMYLSGEFGSDPESVNAYAAGLFYAVDRYASFRRAWGEFYNGGGVILSGRYTTSNIVHQCSKLPQKEWDKYIEWLGDTEYNKMGIPKPDAVVFLDMPAEVTDKMLNNRYGGDQSKKDIHESDREYELACRKTALYAAEKCGWIKVPCANDGEPRPINDISDDIMNIVKSIL